MWAVVSLLARSSVLVLWFALIEGGADCNVRLYLTLDGRSGSLLFPQN